MITDTQAAIGTIVAEDFRTAAVFSKYGIDFCCKGYRTIEEVCEEHSLSERELLTLLNEAESSLLRETEDYISWPVERLIDHIEDKHHRYVEDKTAVLRMFLNNLCNVHGKKHPELFEINNLFMLSAGDLASHIKKEELILFPFIRQMAKAIEDNRPLHAPHFGTVENPIALMKADHIAEGSRFEEIAAITNGYTPPEDACNTYKATFELLREFQADLHIHIHLENNILFPKAIALEQKFENR